MNKKIGLLLSLALLVGCSSGTTTEEVKKEKNQRKYQKKQPRQPRLLIHSKIVNHWKMLQRLQGLIYLVQKVC